MVTEIIIASFPGRHRDHDLISSHHPFRILDDIRKVWSCLRKLEKHKRIGMLCKQIVHHW